MLHFIFLCG